MNSTFVRLNSLKSAHDRRILHAFRKSLALFPEQD
jgi:hypothetical protein